MDPGQVFWLPGSGFDEAGAACQDVDPSYHPCYEWEGDGGWYVWCCPY